MPSLTPARAWTPRRRVEVRHMKVLVAYATRHGATRGIAERIADRLRAAGLEADARPVAEVRDLGPYGAVVVGGAAYMFHWLKDATSFVRKNQAELGRRPVWLFSSGPIGTDLVDKDGRDVFEASEPKELPELGALVGARGTRVFFGAWDPKAPPIGIAERFMRFIPASADLPAGDFRDWPAIEAWADEIARDLAAVPAG
jgi:menaquinone-dependent protoporphyrinogen oxidase